MDHRREKKPEPIEQNHVNGAPPHEAEEAEGGEGELKITVRKLELPVRPRGVLAE